uniref:thioesterase domain-containing protein n=2 Tax=Sphingobacterium TaxID=28453 RepID=UPI0028963638
CSVWAEVLGVERVGVEDNYFSLGGNSILMVSIIRKLKDLGYDISYRNFYKYQNIQKISETIGTNSLSDKNIRSSNFNQGGKIEIEIKELNQSQKKDQIFLFPGSPGEIWAYEELAKGLEPCYLVYGLQMPGLKDNELPIRTICEVGSMFKNTIKKHLKSDRIRIIGHSLGAYVGYEVIKQMQEEGIHAQDFIILDAPSNKTITGLNNSQKTTDLLEKVKYMMNALNILESKDPSWYGKMFEHLFDSKEELKIETVLNYLEQTLNYKRNSKYNLQVLRAMIYQYFMDFAPNKILEGETLIIKSIENQSKLEHPSMGWSKYCRSYKIQESPGTHTSMVEGENASILAGKIISHLSK